MGNKTIGILGLWHLGCVLASCLAKSGIKVIAYDLDKNIIGNLKNGIAPLYEPGLTETIIEQMDKEHLFFTDDISALSEADFMWITADTPLDENDNCDISKIIEYMKVLNQLEHKHSYIISSQVPVGTCEELISYIDADDCKVAYIPENFQLGRAIQYFETTDYFIIGSDDEEYAESIKHMLASIYSEPMLCSLRTAEMLKHAVNSFFATVISYSNALSELAVEMGADAYKIVEMMKKEPRIRAGKLPLLPGPWFSGGTLARDVRVLGKIKDNSSEAKMFFDKVLAVNNARCEYLLERTLSNQDVYNCSVAVLGMIYKNGTDTLRRSPGLQIVANLHKKQVKNIQIFDSLVKKDQIRLDEYQEAIVCDTIVDAIADTNVVIIVRDDIAQNMSMDEWNIVLEGKVVLDIPNCLTAKGKSNYIHIKPGFSH